MVVLQPAASLELLVGDVVHGQVVHVGLDEFECLILNHLDSFALEHAAELLDHLTADTLPLLAGLVEGVADDLLNVVERLDALAHA